jgi:hypothetical protein
VTAAGPLNTGALALQDVTVRQNAAANSGGIASEGPPGSPVSLALRAVTVTGNTAASEGGGPI